MQRVNVTIGERCRMQKLWIELVFDITCAFPLFFLDSDEELPVMIDEEFVPKQKTDHAPPVDMRTPFVSVLRALLCKALECGEIDVRIVQLLEQHLDGRRTGYSETMKRKRKAPLLLSPKDLFW